MSKNEAVNKIGDGLEAIGKQKARVMWWVLIALPILAWILGRFKIPF